jgi:ankyrin repeat protein
VPDLRGRRRQGADRTLMNNNGKTALDIAKEMGNKKMITILSK